MAADLWVIVTGLGAVVGTEPTNPTSAHTLLLQPVPPRTEVLGVRISPHETQMRLDVMGTNIVNVEHKVVVLPGSEAPARLISGHLLLPIGERLEPPALRLRPEVFSTRFATVMEFTGGDLWPIQVRRNFVLTELSLDVRLGLMGAHHIRSRDRVPKSRYVANGLLYRKPLGSAPVVRVDGRPYSPALVPQGQTGGLPVERGRENYVLWLTNTGDDDCGEFDRDFYLLYDWLADREVARYVPVIDCKLPLANPPGQCMFSYAIGQP